jgi:hypothetical protein
VESSELLMELIKINNRDILYKDENGNYHFNGDIKNARVLDEKLNKIGLDNEILENNKDKVLQIYEDHFNHKLFTGRSGTFFKYEGLGSIYWHMVSKLLLAVQENYLWALDNNSKLDDLQKLKKYYYEIKEGIGVHKSPQVYGAFPTDPYSHTPIFSGVQQPGMTGQVKEDIITRYIELGINIKEGRIIINPALLNYEEFLREDKKFHYYDVSGECNVIELHKGSIGFTFCQVPFIINKSEKDQIAIYKSDGTKELLSSLELGSELSKKIFTRENFVQKVAVELKQ